MGYNWELGRVGYNEQPKFEGIIIPHVRIVI